MNYFPEEVLEHTFDFITSNKDRNSISLVCKSWYKVESESRSKVFIGNCYSITPDRLIARFPRLKSLTLKGKPHFADFNLVPQGWGGFVDPWLKVLASKCPGLEELRLKRMVISDESLDLLAKGFCDFKSLVLVSCDGFTTDGLAAIAANCRHLRELDLQENEVDDRRGHWLSCFPETTTSLVSLNFACLKGDVNFSVLERLVSRSPNLRSLKVNRGLTLEMLTKILVKAPQLVDLGPGSVVEDDRNSITRDKFTAALSKCVSIRSLSGFLNIRPSRIPSVPALCGNLTSLNLSYATGVGGSRLILWIKLCKKLRHLWILDSIGNKGLEVVADSCKDLEELRVFPSDLNGDGTAAVTEEGLVAVSLGCPKLNSVLYFCQQMTNAALITIAKNCPNFIRFRLCILDPVKPDPVTMQPLDEGFGAIVQSCKNLRRLSISGLLTDQVFLYIGMYAEQLEMLSIAFAGDSDKAMQYVLHGCKKLRKLEIQHCPFGNLALLTDVGKYESMRSLWMSSCEVTLGGCKKLAKEMPRLNVEIINENDHQVGADGAAVEEDDGMKVEKMYLYRTLVGPRQDAPEFVRTL